MSKVSVMIVFLLGLALGVAGTILLPSRLRPYLPESLRGIETVVRGNVVAKQRKDGALLVTVSTSQGAILATFEQKADEINLLVTPGAEIEFSLPRYEPFITDPTIRRVVMGEGKSPAGQEGLPAKVVAPDGAPSVGDSGVANGGQRPLSPEPAAGPQHEVK